MVHHDTVLLVGDADLDLVQSVQDVQFREGQGGVVVEGVCPLEEWDVQPAATPPPARRHSELGPSRLQVLANIVGLKSKPCECVCEKLFSTIKKESIEVSVTLFK